MSEANVKAIGEYKVDLSQRTEFWQQLIYFLKIVFQFKNLL